MPGRNLGQPMDAPTQAQVRDAMRTVQARLDHLDRLVRQQSLEIEATVRRRRPAQ